MDTDDEKKETRTAEIELRTHEIATKTATPLHTVDWYIKWVSSMFILAAMSMRGVEGLQLYDLILSVIGVAGWLVVSAIWEDRALIMLNSFGLVLLLKNFITLLVGE